MAVLYLCIVFQMKKFFGSDLAGGFLGEKGASSEGGDNELFDNWLLTIDD